MKKLLNFKRYSKSTFVLLLIPIFFAAGLKSDTEKVKLSTNLATLFRSARAVISANQGLINDASKGDKGLTGKVVIAAAKENFAKTTGKPFAIAASSTLAGQAQAAIFDGINDVMLKAQPWINEQGKGFKGFLPAVFAKQLANAFNTRMVGKMFIKLTAPKNYVRNRANRPDKWENSIIENKFRSTGWELNKSFSETSIHKGKPAFRLLIPEYYGPTCLGCHGEPKGALDKTGGKKEGGKLGELGGAISLVIYE